MRLFISLFFKKNVINGRKRVIEMISVPQFWFSFQVVLKLLLALFNLDVASVLLLFLWLRVLRLFVCYDFDSYCLNKILVIFLIFPLFLLSNDVDIFFSKIPWFI